MTKSAQNLLLITLGAAALWITVATDEYLNYVKPGFRWALIAAAVAVIALGAAGLRREWRDTGEHDDHDEHEGHEHGHGPRVAWLLCLPALGIFLIAPPALGSFTAERNSARAAAPPPAPAEGYGELRSTGAPLDMTISEFIGRSFEAQTGDPGTLRDIPVRLSGFVAPRPKGDGWYLTRLRMSCCAGDAIPMRVIVHGGGRPEKDAWVSVVGTWLPPTAGTPVTGVHELRGQSVRPVKKPKNPYE